MSARDKFAQKVEEEKADLGKEEQIINLEENSISESLDLENKNQEDVSLSKDHDDLRKISDMESQLEKLRNDLNISNGRGQKTVKALQSIEKKLSKFDNLVENMTKSASINGAGEKPSPRFDDLGNFVSPEDIETVGGDFARFTYDTSKKVAEKSMQSLRAEMQDLKAEVTQYRKKTAANRVAEQVPDYRQILNSDEFESWLQQRPQGSSLTHAQTYDVAEKSGDFDVIIELLNMYKQAKGMSSSGNGNLSRNSLDYNSMATPAMNQNSAIPQQNSGKKIYKKEDVDRYMNQITKERIQTGRMPKDFDKINAQLLQAQAEGRIV